jgi:hypothetical protein
VARHDHVLQRISQAGFDSALVAGRDVEVVGHRSGLLHGAARIGEHHPRRIAVGRPCRLELLERLQPGGGVGQLLLVLAQGQGQAVALCP